MDTPQFPGFEIIETLPRGGMSTVYKVRQISLDRIVALKALPTLLAVESADLNQFLAEARITANLKHPNIVQVYDFGHTDEGIYYFVMEFISGYSVGDWIRRKKCLSEQNSLLVAQSVAEALNYAWENAGVVHCDIKPDNIIIDGDGTVKVADLGLAKSVRSVVQGARASSGMVFGTPNYISPEQSRGDVELDCRSDIYSLGATLYHAMGGKMPFEGTPALTAMDLQITDQIPDIQDQNPHISIESSFLLEHMLAKDRNRRQADWDAVQVDINRVMQHKAPHGELPPAGASTMRRSAHRGVRPRVKASVTFAIPVVTPDQAPDNMAFQNMQRQFVLKQKKKQGAKPEWWFAGVIALAVLILGIMVVRSIMRSRAADHADRGASSSSIIPGGRLAAKDMPAPAEARGTRDENARKMLEYAQQWARDNPKRPEEAIQNFRKVAHETRGTEYSLRAQAEVAKCQEAFLAARAAVMRDLENRAGALLVSNEFGKAAALYEQYQGDLAAETAASRGIAARDLKERDREYREQQQKITEETERRRRQAAEESERQMRKLTDSVCARLVEGDVQAALASVKQAAKTPAPASRKEPIEALAGLLTEAARLDQQIIHAFRPFKGQTITVGLVSGPEKMTIKDVQNDTVQAEQMIVVGAGHIIRPKSFRFADLAISEKRLRLMADNKPDMPFMQGLLSVRERDWVSAESWFAKTDPVLSAALLASLARKQSAQDEDQAKRELLGLFRNARIDMPGENAGCDEYLAAIAKKKFTVREAELLAKAAERYSATYGQTRFAKRYEPVLKTLRSTLDTLAEERDSVPIPVPKFQTAPDRPQQEIQQAPPAAGSPDAVRKQLMDRNPGVTLRMLELQTDPEEKIVRVKIQGGLKDLQPLAGLSDLRCVDISGNRQLNDLSPLKGLPLQELYIGFTQVKDLSPLIGMPLVKLGLNNTKITGIDELKGMSLVFLTIDYTRVRDIGVLRDMPLQSLSFNHAAVIDLAPLKGKTSLECLRMAGTAVSSLSFLWGTSLVELNIQDTRIRDTVILGELPLKALMMSRSKASDFAFLSKLNLNRLEIAQTDFQDLSLLQGMPLNHLDISGTKCKEQDLVVLQDLPLAHLGLNDLPINSLETLCNIKSLRSLSIRQTRIKNLELLETMPIEILSLDMEGGRHNEKIWNILRRMPNLRRINGQRMDQYGRRNRR